jgi:hypothetical protein
MFISRHTKPFGSLHPVLHEHEDLCAT